MTFNTNDRAVVAMEAAPVRTAPATMAQRLALLVGVLLPVLALAIG